MPVNPHLHRCDARTIDYDDPEGPLCETCGRQWKRPGGGQYQPFPLTKRLPPPWPKSN
jgi:hypothetical protein